MSVGSKLNLLNELNKLIICEPLASIILLYSTSSINLEMERHEYIYSFLSRINNGTVYSKK
jgi:hypothetical protein